MANTKVSAATQTRFKKYEFKSCQINNYHLIFSTINIKMKPMACYVKIREINSEISIKLTRSEFMDFTKFVTARKTFPSIELVPTCFSYGDITCVIYGDGGFNLLKKEKLIYIHDPDLKTMEMYFPGFIFIMDLIHDYSMFPHENPLEDTYLFVSLVKGEVKSIDEPIPEKEMIINCHIDDESKRTLRAGVWLDSASYFQHLGRYFSSYYGHKHKIKGDFLKNLKKYYGNDMRVLRSLTLIIKTITRYKYE